MKAEEMRADYSVLNAPETIASGWRRVRLGDIAEVVRGVTYKKEQASENPARDTLPILRATNIQDGALVLDSDLVYVPADLISDTQMLRVGDIVVATSSGSKHLVGKTAQVKETWEGSFGAFCAAIRPTTDIDHRYLGYFFESREYKDYIVKKALGVNINNLRRGDLEEISVPVAPLNQQKRIVAEIEKQFSRLDEAVANLKRVKANLKRYKAAVLKAAVEGRLVETEAERARKKTPSPLAGEGGGEGASFETGAQLLQRILETRRSQWQGKGKYKEPAAPDTTDLPELPEGWVWASLDQLTSKITSGSRDWSQYYGRGTGIFVLAQNVRPFNPDFSVQQFVDPPSSDSSCDRSRIQDGDLLATIVGANAGQICLVAKAPSDAYVCQSVALIRPVLLGAGAHLNYWLNSAENGQRYLDQCMYGQGRPHLSFEQLMAAPIALPPLAEQQRIVAEVERSLSLIRETATLVDANLKRAERLRQSILQMAFSSGGDISRMRASWERTK